MSYIYTTEGGPPRLTWAEGDPRTVLTEFNRFHRDRLHAPARPDPSLGLPASGPVRDLADAPRTLLGDASKQKPRYYCQRSKYTLISPALDGTRQLIHAPCRSNRCPYCGRVNMYRKRNRLYDRIKLDRETGLDKETAYEFLTVTLREGAVSEEDAYKYIKKSVAYAIQKVRLARKFNKRYRRAAWDGAEIEYVNDVDVQPGTGMPHIHSLLSVRFPNAKKKKNKGIEQLRARYSKRMAKELQYYATNWLRKRLGLETYRWREGEPYPYQGSDSIMYCHFSSARSNENCLMYMALHNGKIWTDGREYPRNYRRFATSRGYLAKEEKEPTGYEFVRSHLELIVGKLLDPLDLGHSRSVTPLEYADDGKLLSVSIPAVDVSHQWETESGVGRELSVSADRRLNFAAGKVKPERASFEINGVPLSFWQGASHVEVMAKMNALEEYWESGAADDGARTEWYTPEPKEGRFGPCQQAARFVPGLTFEQWKEGFAPASLSQHLPAEVKQPAPDPVGPVPAVDFILPGRYYDPFEYGCGFSTEPGWVARSAHATRLLCPSVGRAEALEWARMNERANRRLSLLARQQGENDRREAEKK